MTAFVAALAILFGPPSPVLHSQADQVTAGRGSYCWAGETDANGLEPYTCADTPPQLPERALEVSASGRVRVDMRTETESLIATLRGRGERLPVEPAGHSKRSFVVRLPRRLGQRAVVDLRALYPKGDGAFSALVSTPPRPAPPRPVLTAGPQRLAMARGSYCWSRPPVGLCVHTRPPTTASALSIGRSGEVQVDTRIGADLVAASIRRGPRELFVDQVDASKRRFVVVLPPGLERGAVLELFVRYPQGDGSFGARLRVRR